MEQYAERIPIPFLSRADKPAPGSPAHPDAFPLLTTRVHVPPVPLNLVARPHLINTLDRGIRQRKLTLLLAPAGSGKTTLLSAWRAAPASSSMPAAWISLDERDNDPKHFLAYLLLALQSVQSVEEFQQFSRQEPSDPLSEELLIRLLNVIASTITYDFALILDNYHTISHPAIQRALAFLLRYSTRSMHLVIASRVQPPFALIKLRAQGQLWELNSQDLRFDAQEAALFLNTTMGLALEQDEVEELHQQTEGWITGLQLAAYTLQKRRKTETVLKTLVRNRRYVFDYLATEVFARQPPELQELLLQTSLLEHFNLALGLAVTGQDNEQLFSTLLEQTDIFLVRLDEDGEEWYRYHPLFREFLAHTLHAQRPADIPIVQRRASAWLEHQENIPPVDSGEPGTTSTTQRPDIARPLEPLSAREVDVLHLVVLGNTNQEIAQQLSLALCTVKWHVKNIYGKLQVHNRVQLVRNVQQLGL